MLRGLGILVFLKEEVESGVAFLDGLANYRPFATECGEKGYYLPILAAAMPPRLHFLVANPSKHQLGIYPLPDKQPPMEQLPPRRVHNDRQGPGRSETLAAF